MKAKTLTLMGLSVLSLVILTAFASAVVIAEWNLTDNGVASNVASNVDANDFVAGSGVSDITFASNGAFASSWTIETFADDDDYFQISISPNTGYDLTITDLNFGIRKSSSGPEDYTVKWSKESGFGTSTTIDSATLSDDSEVDGSIVGLDLDVDDGETLYIRWFGYDADAATGTLRINDGTLSLEGAVSESTEEPDGVGDFCEWDDGVSANPGDLRIKIKDITNNGMKLTNTNFNKQFGDDEEWFPFEEIEVEVEIENKGDDDIDDISLEWGLFNEDTGEWTIEVDDEDEFDVKDGDEETVIFTFTIDDDMDEDLDEINGGKLILYVRVTGEVDNDDNDDTCNADSEEVEIIIENDWIVLNDIEIPETVLCGSTVQITADVWNIGDDDQDDVSVRIFNTELDISEKIEIGDIDAFENERLSFDFKIPVDADEKTYTLEFEVLDEDNDVYENDYDDEESEFSIYLKVEGGCGMPTAQAVISASLESGGEAGQEIVIKASVTNTGDELVTYSLMVTGYNSWAGLPSVSPETLILGAGETKDVSITLEVNKDVSGEQLFDIELFSGSDLVVRQPVGVSIQESGFGGFGGGAISRDNMYLWGIGILNIILVIIIIIVAVRVARK